MVTKVIATVIGFVIFTRISAQGLVDTFNVSKRSLYIECGISSSNIDPLFRIGNSNGYGDYSFYNQNKRPSIKMKYEKKLRENIYLGLGLQHSMKGFHVYIRQPFQNRSMDADMYKQYFYFEIPLYVSYHSSYKNYTNFEVFGGITINQLYRTRSGDVWATRSESAINNPDWPDSFYVPVNAYGYYNTTSKFDYIPKVSLMLGGYVKPKNISPRYSIGICYTTDIGNSFHYTNAVFLNRYLKYVKYHGKFSMFTLTLRYQLNK